MRSPRLLLTLAVAATALTVGLVAPSRNDTAEAAIGGITWQDEFNAPNGTAADSSKWNFDIGGGGFGNNEREYYTNSTRNAVQDGQGNLVITARKENPSNYQCWYGTCQYTSARLLTSGKFTQKYGRFEARIKIPRGQGMWPAFWMLGDNLGSVGWPNSGEIDVMENVGKDPNNVYGSLHGPGYSGGNSVTAGRNNGSPYADAFHTYTVDWEPNAVTWYVDGQQYSRKTPADTKGGAWVFDHPFFIIMNLAVGGIWPGDPDASTAFPATMLVDYVRVSAYTSAPGGGGTSRIKSNGGRCIDINGGIGNDGTQLQIFDCNTSAAQQWTFSADGTIRGLGKCMDVAGGNTANGTAVQLANCNGGQAQQFRLNASNDLVSVLANKCVDVNGGINANFTKLILWPCSGAWNQKWSKA
jgi:beta-glucanase (GH16 family)